MSTSISTTSSPRSSSRTSRRVLHASSPSQRPPVPGPSPSSSTPSSSRKRLCPPPPIISKEGENIHLQTQNGLRSGSRSPRKRLKRVTTPPQQPEVEMTTTLPSLSPPKKPKSNLGDHGHVTTYASVCAPPPAEVEMAPPSEVFLALDDENEFPSLVKDVDIDMENNVDNTAKVVDVSNNELLGAGADWNWNWMKSMKTDEEKYDFMRKSPHYQKYLDVKFIVGEGGETEIIFGHELLLVLKCEYFWKKFYVNKDKDKVKFIKEGTRSQWCLKEVHLPEFEPKGFQFLIDYLYTGKIDISDLSVVLKAEKCAQKMGHLELMRKLGSYLKMNLTKDNAVQVYCLALAQNDLELARESMTFICSNISDVVASNGFLNLSEEDLCRFLDSDEWDLGDEVKVFEFVKRWATYKKYPTNPSKKILSKELSRLMGRAVYGIRFTQFSSPLNEFFKLQPYLLSSAEIGQLIMYVSQSGDDMEEEEVGEQENVPLPPHFVARPRGVSTGSTLALEKVIHPVPQPEEPTLLEAEFGSGAEPGRDNEEPEPEINQEPQMEGDLNLANMDDSHDFLESDGEDGKIQLEPDGEKNDGNQDGFEAEMGVSEMECVAPAAASEGDDEASKNSEDSDSEMECLAPATAAESDEDSDKSVDSDLGDSEDSENSQASESEDSDSDDLSQPQPSSSSKTKQPNKPSKLTMTRMNDQNSSLKKMRAKLAAKGKPDVSKFRTLLQLKMDFSDKDVTEINETLLLTASSSKRASERVYLPKLDKFEVRFVNEKIVDSRASLKRNMKKLFSNLSDILFFDVNVDHKMKQGKILENLLGTGVNILITFAQSTILLIDHDEGKVILNMLGSQADEILKGCRKSGFCLKILGICEGHLSSLNRIPKKDLEVLQIRAVSGLKGKVGLGDFLLQCPNLKSVSWSHLTVEPIQMNEIVRKLRNLEHLALLGCLLLNFSATPFKNLKTLLLDHSGLGKSFLLQTPENIFPSVKKVLIYGGMGTSEILYWILRTMPSLEWIFIWKMDHCYLSTNRRTGRPRITGAPPKAPASFIKKFIGEVFDETFASTKCPTFILKKKKRQDYETEQQEGGVPSPIEDDDLVEEDESSSDDDASHVEVQNLGRLPSEEWEGEALQSVPEQFKALNERAFEFNRNEEFFKDYGVFDLMESTSPSKTDDITKLLCSPYYRQEINDGQ